MTTRTNGHKPPTPHALRRWRTTRGLTLMEAAALAGVHYRSWLKWERSERRVPHWLRAVLTKNAGAAP